MDDNHVQSYLDTWKRKLIDISKRSNLIKYKYKKTKTLHVSCPGMKKVIQDLSETDKIYLPKNHEYSKEYYWDLFENDSTINKKLLNIYYTNRENELERGINNCHVALFLLHYTEPGEKEHISAPLFLKKIQLEKNRDKKYHGFNIVVYDSEFELNLALIEKLKADHDVVLPDFKGDILSYIGSLENTIKGLGWYITPFVCIDNFNYQKQMMFEEMENYPQFYTNSLLIKQYIGIHDNYDMNIDELTHSMDTSSVDVLLADSSQKQVIENVKNGKSVVVQGPPGTGKSQTIANIIVSLMNHGKKILFVSQKKAALDVVYVKLQKIGFHDYCLQLHATDTNKKDVVSDIVHQLTYSHKSGRYDHNKLSTYLHIQRKLNNYYDKLNNTNNHENFNKTIYELRGYLSNNNNVPQPTVSLLPLVFTLNESLSDVKNSLDRFIEYTEFFDNPLVSPLCDVKFSSDDTETLSTFSMLIKRTYPQLKYFMNGSFIDEILSLNEYNFFDLQNIYELHPLVQDNKDLINESWEWDLSSIISHLSTLIESYDKRKEIVEEIQNYVTDDYLETDTIHYENVYQSTGMIGKLFNKEYKQAEKALSRYAKYNLTKDEWTHVFSLKNSYLDIYKKISTYEKSILTTCVFNDNRAYSINNVQALHDSLNVIREIYSKAYAISEKSSNDLISLLLDKRQEQFIQNINDVLKVNDYFSREYLKKDDTVPIILEKISLVHGHIDYIKPLFEALRIFHEFPQTLQDFIVEYLEKEFSQSPYPLSKIFEKSFYHAAYEHMVDADLSCPHAGDSKTLRTEVDEVRDISRKSLFDTLNDRKPKDYYGKVNASISTLKREENKKRRLKPLRDLFVETSDILFSIKPCFMMSPLAVCQYINLKSLHFDVVIFDEASQIIPEDAASCLVRADQAVIAGDSEQLPPTNFFNRDDDYEEEDIEILPSFLYESSTRFPELYLQWHYRSNDESLITFSNSSFYNNRLVTFPSNKANDDVGVKFVYVENGIYDRGKSRKNVIEANRVVQEYQNVVDTYPEKSIGIIALSISQQKAIYEAFEKQGYVVDDLENSNTSEPLFIKNLETVQGDERDIILLSIGYGRDGAGKLTYNFGPVNREEGYKRVNVAVTRSRDNTIVISSISYKDLQDTSLNNRGARSLKNYLRYAETGQMEGFTYSEEDLAFDSEFEEVVYDALVERGYSVKTQVGCSGYRIDLAIVDENHPGTYLLGIECDGSQYHASKFARDRDVIRQNILESLGWKIYRIWSNDWMTNRDGILDEIDEIIKEDNQENQITRSVSFSQLEKEKTLHDVDLGARYPKYEDVLPNKKNIKFHDYIYDERIPRSTTLYRHCEESVNAILEKEAPIDKDFLMRKVLSSVGVKRYTERTRKIFDDFLYYYKKNNPIVIEYNTIFTNGVTSLCPVRLSTDDQRPFEYIPMQELAQAVLDFIKPCAAEKENIIREVPNKIYGYNRIGNKIRDRMIATLNYLSSFGYIEDGNGKIKIADDSN